MCTKVFLPREIFNSLISALTYFIATENQIGKTFFSKYAAKLKTKIMQHGRIFNNTQNENAQSVSINLYGNESAILIKLLIYYISLGEESTQDFFTELQKAKITNA
jgi:hypothetical protein